MKKSLSVQVEGASQANADWKPPLTSASLFLLAATSAFVGLAAISGRTLWIDEALTAVKAQLPTFGAWWAQMLHERASDLQMPLYMLYIWAWEKAWGSSEWILRMANLPWFVAGATVFGWGQRFITRRLVFTVAGVLLSPFAWYYLDEARPYAMQLGSSMMIVGALCKIHSEPSQVSRATTLLFCVGVVLLSGSSMLGMIWAGAAVLAWAVLLGRRLRPVLVADFFLVLPGGILLACLGVYYLWALSSGARAAALPTNLQSMFFIGYEILGFAGLGPGRLELRAMGATALKPYLPYLVIYGGLSGVVLWNGFKCLPGIPRQDPAGRKVFLLPMILSLPVLFLLIAGLALTFRVLGRHMTPVFPCIALLMGAGMSSLWRHGIGGKAATGFFLVLTMWSCLEIRTAPRHSKDDYKQASAEARAGLEANKQVWWNADEEGARYYGVKVNSTPTNHNAAWLCLNPEPGSLEKEKIPDLIIISRPDVYDNTGALARYIVDKGYVQIGNMPAFSIWTKPAK